jgi:hypothetical protein
MKTFITALSLLISTTLFAQNKSSLEFSLGGGIKRNVFKLVSSRITAYNISPGYEERLVTPDVGNTFSFFTSLKTAKKINNHFALNTTIGLDMQQLSIESGFKKQNLGGVTSFSQEKTSTLLPRLKLDFGIDYILNPQSNNRFSLGLNAGEMLHLSNKGYSYSFIGSTIGIATKNVSFFLNGSLSPYNVSLPDMQNYFGNLNADVIGASEYRIYDLSVGAMIKL